MRIFLIMTGSFAVSLAGKLLADALMWEDREIIGMFLRLHHTTNTGVAFGILFPPLLQWIAIVAALFFVLLLLLHTEHTSLSVLGFGLIFGGALANILDRLSDGLVTDFIAIGSFPVFNVADSFITIGVGLLCAAEMIHKKAWLEKT